MHPITSFYSSFCSRNVKLFHGCDPGLLKSLVLKLQPMIFLPNDYICRKGDVGKEMFIVTIGQVQVMQIDLSIPRLLKEFQMIILSFS